MAYYQPYAQASTQATTVVQRQDQGLIIRNSHSILVNQVELDGVIVLQASLLAAIEALLIAIDLRDDVNTVRLQQVAQTLTTLEQQRQRIVIEDSNNITLSQIEVQIDVAVQAAIQLLATITAKFIEA